MKISSLIRCAYVSVKKDKLKSFLSILGIIIGVITVVTVLSISDAFNQYVMNEYNKVGSNLMWINPDYSNLTNVDSTLKWNEFDSLKELSFIERMSPYSVVSEDLDMNGKAGYVNVVGVTNQYYELRMLSLIGRFIDETDERNYSKVCVITDEIRKLYFSKNINPIGETIKLGSENYTVVGYLNPKDGNANTGLDDENSIYIPYSTLSKYYNRDSVNMVLMSIKDENKVAQYKSILEQNLMTLRNKGYTFKIDSVSDNIHNVKFIFKVIKIVTMLITSISLLVSGIGIMNVLLMSIAERKWEIGLRKAVGADNRSILLQFLFESLFLCIIGATIGLALSFSTIIIVSFIAKINVSLSIYAICVSVIFCFMVGLIFGMFPAMKAAKFEPLECLEQ